MRITRLIWADDDSNGNLRALGRILTRRSFQLTEVSNLQDGLAQLDSCIRAGHVSETSVLVDVILPQTKSGEALNPYLGLEFGEESASAGVPRVCFLTVLGLGEIDEAIGRLRKEYPATAFEYTQKLGLLEPNRLAQMIQFLSGVETSLLEGTEASHSSDGVKK